MANKIEDFNFSHNKMRSAPHLRVDRVTPDQRNTLMAVARTWVSIARERKLQTEAVSDREQFDSCAKISLDVAERLDYLPLAEPIGGAYFVAREVYVCKDERGVPQAFGIWLDEETSLSLEYLVTNPMNLPFSRDGKGIRGAGTLLLKEVERRAFDLGKARVYLCPLPPSTHFYEKYGYAWSSLSMCNMEKRIHDSVSVV